MEYSNSELSQKEQAKKFRQDFDERTNDELNADLTYGCFDYTYNNRRYVNQSSAQGQGVRRKYLCKKGQLLVGPFFVLQKQKG